MIYHDTKRLLVLAARPYTSVRRPIPMQTLTVRGQPWRATPIPSHLPNEKLALRHLHLRRELQPRSGRLRSGGREFPTLSAIASCFARRSCWVRAVFLSFRVSNQSGLRRIQWILLGITPSQDKIVLLGIRRSRKRLGLNRLVGNFDGNHPFFLYERPSRAHVVSTREALRARKARQRG